MVRLRQSGILRVHYRMNGDYQTFYSIIVTPSMTTRDVVQVAAARFAPDENPDLFELVKRGQGGGKLRLVRVHNNAHVLFVVFY